MANDARAELLAEPTELDQAYWDGLAAGKFRVQQCGACGRWQTPPETFCYHCGSDDVAWKDASGKGTVDTFITVHHLHHAPQKPPPLFLERGPPQPPRQGGGGGAGVGANRPQHRAARRADR